MKRFKRALVALVIAAVALTPLSAATTPAYAASPYDHVISPLDSLNLVHYTGDDEVCRRDLSLTWDSDFRNLLEGADLASFDNREAWIVVVADGSEDGSFFLPNYIRIHWWEASEMPALATFITEDALRATAPTQNGYLHMDDNCDLVGGTQGSYDPLIAEYQDWAPRHSNRPFIAQGITIDYPTGYEGQYIPDTYTPPVPTYVAMGDSFSSGEGNAPFENGTDVDGINKCHRSAQAYPRLLVNDLTLDLGPVDFVACSGATTSNITTVGQWGEPRQLDALSELTEVVTLTIGGNDVGFSTALSSCTLLNENPPWPMSQDAYDEQVCISAMEDAERKVYGLSLLPTNETFQDALDNTLESIANEIGDETKVFLVGYPYLFPEYVDTQGSCMWGALYGAAATSARSASEDEVDLLRSVTELLNTNLFQAIDRLDDERFEYVDATAEFEGYNLCRWESYITHIHYSVQEGHYHPNEDGQLAYYRVVKEAIG